MSLNVAKAHQIGQGEGVIVGVVDSGVNADHPDLIGNVLPGSDLTGEKTNGQKDTDGHGTAMAGLIAAHGHGPRNAHGSLGMAPRAKILPIRSGRGGPGDATNLPVAIEQAVRGGATVLSLSLGAGTFAGLRESIQAALDADVVVVAASGNRPEDALINYPAAYPGVVAVGATDRLGRIAPITVTGRAMVVTAPGVDIVSADGIGGYRIGTGTSDATAIVAGAAALVRSKYPELSATEVVHRLTATATDKGPPGRDAQYGYGVVNLVAALTADVAPASPGTASPSPAADRFSAASGPAAAPPADSGPAFRLSVAFYVAVGLALLAVLAAIGLAAWVFLRRSRRGHRSQPSPGAPLRPPSP